MRLNIVNGISPRILASCGNADDYSMDLQAAYPVAALVVICITMIMYMPADTKHLTGMNTVGWLSVLTFAETKRQHFQHADYNVLRNPNHAQCSL